MKKFKPVDLIIAPLVILLSVLLLMTGAAPLLKGVALSGGKAKNNVMTDDICNRLTLLEERRIQDRRKIVGK